MWLLFIIGYMGLFVYIQKGSIISMVDLPTTEIIEPKNDAEQASLQTEDKVLRIDFLRAFLRI
ncbi:hypothetical protein CWI26_08500 [Streptococcus suis]|uniref:Uncharacterized protein n=1 Tax=Streptococcus suis TaxID=1307 RepID=A0A2I5KQ69_STRSU|nr:hypothetical protein CWI26_08500 [Streptococcus suis]